MLARAEMSSYLPQLGLAAAAAAMMVVVPAAVAVDMMAAAQAVPVCAYQTRINSSCLTLCSKVVMTVVVVVAPIATVCASCTLR